MDPDRSLCEEISINYETPEGLDKGLTLEFSDAVERFWMWHRVSIALNNVLDQFVSGSNELTSIGRDIRANQEYAEEKKLGIVEKISRVSCATVTQLKVKAEILKATFDAEIDDIQSRLILSLIEDIIVLPMREYKIDVVTPKKRTRG